jgi:hypothetical protein
MGILMGKEFCLTDLYIKYWDEQCVAVGKDSDIPETKRGKLTVFLTVS